MNSASLEFVGPDELRTVWTEIEAGKPVFVAKSRLVRNRADSARVTTNTID
jgi:hypothetical protein